MLMDVVIFGEQCDFLPKAVNALLAAAELLEKYGGVAGVFVKSREQLFTETGDPWENIDVLSERIGINRFTMHQLFLIYCAEETKVRYEKAGYSEELYWDAMGVF